MLRPMSAKSIAKPQRLSSSPSVIAHIIRHRNPLITSLIADRRAALQLHRQNPRPNRQRIILRIILRRPQAHLRRNLVQLQSQNARRLQLFLIRLPRLRPPPRQNLLRKSAQRLQSSPRPIHQRRLPQRHHRPVIHRMIENRSRQHQPIHQRHRHANRNPRADIPQHPARRRPMKINRIPNPREHRRNHKRLPVHRKPDVTNEALIQNLVNRIAVINRRAAARAQRESAP